MKPSIYKIALFTLTLTLATVSCTRYKNLVLLQEEQADSLYTATPPDYKIQKRDVLYVRIHSLNQEITQAINSTSVLNTNQFTNDASLFIYGYNVSDSGFVEIPIIGPVHVLGKTMEEAKQAIEKQTAIMLKDATVVVKLISFKYSVLSASVFVKASETQYNLVFFTANLSRIISSFTSQSGLDLNISIDCLIICLFCQERY